MSTYTQIYIQVVFAVKYRESLILPAWETELYKYITGIVQNKNKRCWRLTECQTIFIF